MRDEQREKLIELLRKCDKDFEKTCPQNSNQIMDCAKCKYSNGDECDYIARQADYLLQNNVVVLPCIAMVEQFIKNGEFDRKITTHNGKIAVVYIDKAKWACPLIDITERVYNTNKAYERIEKLKALERGKRNE